MNLMVNEKVQGQLTQFVVNAENGYDIGIMANEATGKIACIRLYNPDFQKSVATPMSHWTLETLAQHVLYLRGIEVKNFNPVEIEPCAPDRVNLKIGALHKLPFPNHSIAEELQTVVPSETNGIEYAVRALANYIVEKECCA